MSSQMVMAISTGTNTEGLSEDAARDREHSNARGVAKQRLLSMSDLAIYQLSRNER